MYKRTKFEYASFFRACSTRLENRLKISPLTTQIFPASINQPFIDSLGYLYLNRVFSLSTFRKGECSSPPLLLLYRASKGQSWFSFQVAYARSKDPFFPIKRFRTESKTCLRTQSIYVQRVFELIQL